MALTASQEMVLQRLNDMQLAIHEEAKKKADLKGQPHPPAPAPIRPEQVEFPKYLHKGWKETDKAPGHYEPEVSKLAHSPEQEKELIAKGFSHAPPSKKEAVKKE